MTGLIHIAKAPKIIATSGDLQIDLERRRSLPLHPVASRRHRTPGADDAGGLAGALRAERSRRAALCRV